MANILHDEWIEDGVKKETYVVSYERSDGKGTDIVEQYKENGVEQWHVTDHPDGTRHYHGISPDKYQQ